MGNKTTKRGISSLSRKHLSHSLSATSLKKVRLNMGNIKYLDNQLNTYQAEARVDINSRCPGKGCRLSRLKCCAKRGLDISNDRQIMKSQEMRYDSMIQTIKNNSHGVNLFQKFGMSYGVEF